MMVLHVPDGGEGFDTGSTGIANCIERRDPVWPARPEVFREILTPVEAAQYLRLDETGMHTPLSAIRTLKFWRDRGHLRATKYARHVWYRKSELDRFLVAKTES